MNVRALIILLLLAALATAALMWLGGASRTRSLQRTRVERPTTAVDSEARLQPLRSEQQTSAEDPTRNPSTAAVSRRAVRVDSRPGAVRVEFRDAATGKRFESQQVRVRLVHSSVQALTNLRERFPAGVVPHDDRAVHDVRYSSVGKLFTPDRDGWLNVPKGLVSILFEVESESDIFDGLVPVGATERFVLSESEQPITFVLAEPLLAVRVHVNDQFGDPASGITLGGTLIRELRFRTDSDRAPQSVQLSEVQRGLYVGRCLPGQISIKANTPGWSGLFRETVASDATLHVALRRPRDTASVLIQIADAPEGLELRLAGIEAGVWLPVDPDGSFFGDLRVQEIVVHARTTAGPRRGLEQRLGTVTLEEDEQISALFQFVRDQRTWLRGTFESDALQDGARLSFSQFHVGLLRPGAESLAIPTVETSLSADGQFMLRLPDVGTFEVSVASSDFGPWSTIETVAIEEHAVLERTYQLPIEALPQSRGEQTTLERLDRIQKAIEHTNDRRLMKRLMREFNRNDYTRQDR